MTPDDQAEHAPYARDAEFIAPPEDDDRAEWLVCWILGAIAVVATTVACWAISLGG